MAEAEDTTIECGFCCRRNEDLERPKTLPCRHVHCFGCLTAFYEINHMTRCPVPGCGEVVETAIDELPASDKTTTQDAKLYCNVCLDNGSGNKPADAYCIQCEKKYCTNHVQAHDDSNFGHTNLTITEYRVQCNKLVQKDQLLQNKGQLQERKSEVDDTVAGIRMGLVEKEGKLDRLYKHATEAMSSYDTNTEEMRKLLHTTRDAQLERIRQQYDEMEEEMAVKRQEVKLKMSEFVEDKVITTWTKVSNERQKLDARLKRSQLVDAVKEWEAATTMLIEEDLPKLEIPKVAELVKQVESKAIDLEISNFQGFVIEAHQETSTAVIIPKTATLLSSVPLPDDSCASICVYKGSTYVGMHGGSIVRVDSNYNIGECFIRCSGSVRSIAIHDNKVYTLVSKTKESHAVCVFDMSGKFLREWYVSCRPNNVMTLVSDYLVIADKKVSRSFFVYSLEGMLLKQISCDQLCNETHVLSHICAVDARSVVMSDYNCPQVFRIDIKTGKVMWTRDTRDECRPVAVYCYKERYVLLLGRHTNTIRVLEARTGSTISKFRADFESGGMEYGLKIHNNTLALVTHVQWRNHVNFYKLSSEG